MLFWTWSELKTYFVQNNLDGQKYFQTCIKDKAFVFEVTTLKDLKMNE